MRKGVFVVVCAGLLVTACGGSKKVSEGVRRTSGVDAERWRVRTVQVPASRTELRVPVAGGVLPLPPGAVYANRRGQASVWARVVRDTLYIEASCDSLQQLVMEYERRLAQEEHREERVEKRREPAYPVWIWAWVFGVALLAYRKRR